MGGAVYRRLYLRDEEDAALRLLAERHGSSVNAILRAALRILAGLPVAGWALEEARSHLEDE